MEMRKFTKKILSINYTDGLVDVIKTAIQSFQSQNQPSITNYDNWKSNCEKEEYLKNPNYKIYQIKNRNSPSSVVAKVKWNYLFEDKFFEDKYTVVFLGSVKKYPNLSDDIQLQKDVINIIKFYFEEKSPMFKVNYSDLQKMKKEVELYYYWKEKLVELEYRLDPKFYASQSSKDKQENIILNIKWGFEVLGKATKPRYILKRHTTNKNYNRNLDDKSLQHELAQVVKNHIEKVSPVIFTPPLP
jgi:hypothetical protein